MASGWWWCIRLSIYLQCIKYHHNIAAAKQRFKNVISLRLFVIRPPFFFFLCGMHHCHTQTSVYRVDDSEPRYRLIQGEIVGPQVLLDSLHPRSTRTSWWSPPVLRKGSSYDTPGIWLVSSGILAMWPNRERRRAWTIADRRGCPVVRLTSSFRMWWYHLIPNNLQTPLVDGVDLEHISLGDCSALRTIQEDR